MQASNVILRTESRRRPILRTKNYELRTDSYPEPGAIVLTALTKRCDPLRPLCALWFTLASCQEKRTVKAMAHSSFDCRKITASAAARIMLKGCV